VIGRTLLDRVTAFGFDLFMAPLERWKLHRIRAALLPQARGDVLEIGAGTGINLRYLEASNVKTLSLSDADDRRDTLTRRLRSLPRDLREQTEVRIIDAERLPYPDDSFDTVVATLLFCSVDCQLCGFDEIIRVLRPNGVYLFLEHVLPERPGSAWLFDRINPVWNAISRGCNLNRDTVTALKEAGFSVGPLHRDGKSGVFVWGSARPSQRRGIAATPDTTVLDAKVNECVECE
jgi:SAM-dependent methyltransferase